MHEHAVSRILFFLEEIGLEVPSPLSPISFGDYFPVSISLLFYSFLDPVLSLDYHDCVESQLIARNLSNLNKEVPEYATLFLLSAESGNRKRTWDKIFLLRALHFPGKTVLAIMWEYLKLANTFKFSPAQIGLEEILSYLSQKFSRGK